MHRLAFPLALLLAACGSDTATTPTADTASSAPSPTPTPTPTPTPPSSTTDSTPTSPTSPTSTATADTGGVAASTLDTLACDPVAHPLTTAVLATETDWVAYDLDAGTIVPTDAPSWDLRMQTWNVETNGGATGTGGVAVAVFEGLREQADDHCLAPPTDAFAADATSGEAFAGWYDYDYVTHELSAADVLYFVTTTEGAVHRLIFDGYAELDGATHTPGFRHGPVDQP